MELRLRSAANQARGIRDDAIADLIGHDPVAARDAARSVDAGRRRAKPGAARRGRASRSRRRGIRRRRAGRTRVRADRLGRDCIAARAGRASPGSARSRSLARSLRSRANRVAAALSGQRPRLRHAVAAWVAGFAGLWDDVVRDRDRRRGAPSYGPKAACTGRSALAVERPADRVSVSETGAVSLDDVELGAARSSRCSTSIDETDVGDLYTPAPRRASVDGRVSRRAPVASRSAARRARAAVSGSSIASAPRRARQMPTWSIRLVLDAGAPFLRISVQRRESRRAITGCDWCSTPTSPARAVWADAAFGPVLPRTDRTSTTATRRWRRRRRPRRCIATSRCSIEHAGCTVFSDGLAEYEARDDGPSRHALRAVGELSRNDLPERPGHAGWPAPTPRRSASGRSRRRSRSCSTGRALARDDRRDRARGRRRAASARPERRCAPRCDVPRARQRRRAHRQRDSRSRRSSRAKTASGSCCAASTCATMTVDGRWRLPFDASREARLDES